RDAGITGTSGIFNDWTLRITHAPFQFTDSANKQKLKKSLLITAQCNANCTVTTGGDPTAGTFSLTQNQSQQRSLPLSKKKRKRLAKKSSATVTLHANDGYGDVQDATLTVPLKKKRK